jgi:hypothetical protein
VETQQPLVVNMHVADPDGRAVLDEFAVPGVGAVPGPEPQQTVPGAPGDSCAVGRGQLRLGDLGDR